MVRRRAGRAERPVEREPVAVGQLEALREHHLEDVAGVDVLERPPDRGLVLLLPSGDGHRLRQAALEEARSVAAVAEQARAERLGCRRSQRLREVTERESLQHALRQRFGPLLRVGPARQRPRPALPVIEGDQLAHEQQLRLGKERVRAEPLRQALGPGGAAPTEVSDVSAAEGRKTIGALRPFGVESAAQRFQGLRFLAQRQARAVGAGADVAVPTQRSLEEEGVTPLLLIEETEDAERRQQITG